MIWVVVTMRISTNSRVAAPFVNGESLVSSSNRIVNSIHIWLSTVSNATYVNSYGLYNTLTNIGALANIGAKH